MNIHCISNPHHPSRCFSGMVGSQKAICDVVIDYAQPQKALLTQFDIQDTADETQNAVSDTVSQNQQPAEVIKERVHLTQMLNNFL